MPQWLRAEHQIQVAEVLGSMLTGVTFYCWIFCFHIDLVKPVMPILPFLANLWKTRICTLFDVSFMMMLKFRNHSTTLLRRSRRKIRLWVKVITVSSPGCGCTIVNRNRSRISFSSMISLQQAFQTLFTLSMKVWYKLFIIYEILFPDHAMRLITLCFILDILWISVTVTCN